jgi:hypothetical protein
MVAGTIAGSANAQQVAATGDPAYGMQVWRTVANCKDCHGWAANGDPELEQAPAGANLRETAMDAEQLVEVIRCGLPGTQMPYFGASRAWSTNFPCYGMTAADAGDLIPARGDTGLNDRQLQGLAAYILTLEGAPTKEECELFFGPTSSRCGPLPSAAAAPPPM